MRCRACSWTRAAEGGLEEGQGPASPLGQGVRHSGGREWYRRVVNEHRQGPQWGCHNGMVMNRPVAGAWTWLLTS